LRRPAGLLSPKSVSAIAAPRRIRLGTRLRDSRHMFLRRSEVISGLRSPRTRTVGLPVATTASRSCSWLPGRSRLERSLPSPEMPWCSQDQGQQHHASLVSATAAGTSVRVAEGHISLRNNCADALEHANSRAIFFLFIIRIACHICVGADDRNVLDRL